MNHEANYTSISGVPSGHNIHFSSQRKGCSQSKERFQWISL